MIYFGMIMAAAFLYGVVRFYDGLFRSMDKKIKDLEK